MVYDSQYLDSDNPDVSFDERRACPLGSIPIATILCAVVVRASALKYVI